MTPYCTLTQATDYLDSIGINSFVGDDTIRTQCLMRATNWLDITYGKYLPGQIIDQFQTQLYPRTAVSDTAGRYYAQGVIPTPVIQSVALMAQHYYLDLGLSATPVIESEITTVGPIKTEVHYAPQSSTITPDVLLEIDRIMSVLTGVKTTGGSKIVYWG